MDFSLPPLEDHQRLARKLIDNIELANDRKGMRGCSTLFFLNKQISHEDRRLATLAMYEKGLEEFWPLLADHMQIPGVFLREELLESILELTMTEITAVFTGTGRYSSHLHPEEFFTTHKPHEARALIQMRPAVMMRGDDPQLVPFLIVNLLGLSPETREHEIVDSYVVSTTLGHMHS